MTAEVYIIFTYIFSLAGLAMLFVPRLPAVAASFLALLCARFAGAVYVSVSVLVYWAVASAIVMLLRNLQRRKVASGRGNAYVAGGTIAGALVGFALTPSTAAVILGAAAGAFIGAVAYMRTPAGPRYAIGSGSFIQFLCATGLQSVVATAMSAIAAASVFQP